MTPQKKADVPTSVVMFDPPTTGRKSTMDLVQFGLEQSDGKSTMGMGLVNKAPQQPPGPPTPTVPTPTTIKAEPGVTDRLFGATHKREPEPLQPYPEVVTNDKGKVLLRFADRQKKWYDRDSKSDNQIQQKVWWCVK